MGDAKISKVRRILDPLLVLPIFEDAGDVAASVGLAPDAEQISGREWVCIPTVPPPSARRRPWPLVAAGVRLDARAAVAGRRDRCCQTPWCSGLRPRAPRDGLRGAGGRTVPIGFRNRADPMEKFDMGLDHLQPCRPGVESGKPMEREGSTNTAR